MSQVKDIQVIPEYLDSSIVWVLHHTAIAFMDHVRRRWISNIEYNVICQINEETTLNLVNEIIT